jgi:hypothetical protein
VEEVTLRSLIQHAQLMRYIRQTTNSDDGILCQYINIRHWAETIPPQTNLSKTRVIDLCSKAYVEVLQNKLFFHDLDRASIVNQITEVFGSYLERIEEQLNDPQSGAIPGLEALHIFAIGVILAAHPLAQTLGDQQRDPALQVIMSQVQTGLTLLSTRYSVVRTYRNIILELQRVTTLSVSTEKLRSLVTDSDLAVPTRLQHLIFGLTPGMET